MTPTAELLGVLLASWDRSSAALCGLVRVLPAADLHLPVGGAATVAQRLGHLHYVRLIEVAENEPEHAIQVPGNEWPADADPQRLVAAFLGSGAVVRAAVRGRMLASLHMDRHYAHPLLMIQHLLWHDGHHLGQIKLALREAGRPLADTIAGPVSWDLWKDKHPA